MKFRIFSFGKPKHSFIENGILEFESRLKKMVKYESIILKESNLTGKNKIASLNEEEKMILKKIKNNVPTYLMTEYGKIQTSINFSKMIEKDFQHSGNEIQFIIGSAYGFSDPIKKHFKNHFSLSPMTLTHDMARLLLLEQIYRSMTILNGIPYHN